MRDIRPEKVRRKASSPEELRRYHAQSGARLRLLDKRSGAWLFTADRPAKFPGKIKHREAKGWPVVEAYWLPLGALTWRRIDLDALRAEAS